MHSSIQRPLVGSKGFTVMELLVAGVIAVILMGLLTSLAANILTDYKRTRDQMTRRGDIAYAIDLVVRDLEGLITSNTANSDSLVLQPEEVNGAAVCRLHLLSRTTDPDPEDFTGSTRAVSYAIAFQNPIDGGPIDPGFAIYRSIASAQHTFVHAVNSGLGLAGYWNSIPPTPLPAPTPTTAISNYIAPNIVGFTVRFLRADNGQWTHPNQSVRIGSNGSFVNWVNAATPGTLVQGGFTRAEVKLIALSPEGANRLNRGIVSMDEAIRTYGQTALRETAIFGASR